MPEAYSWREGLIYLYTGTATASALVAFARNTNITPQRGWLNRQTVGGGYYDHLTGQRVDVQIGAFYTTDNTILKMVESATALHMKFLHSAGAIGSGGYFLYSGRVDSMPLKGTEGGVYEYSLNYHANAWSAF